MNTTYTKRFPSPFQPQQLRKKAFNVQGSNRPIHPVREEIDKIIGSYNLTATIKEDAQTLATMKHIGGMIAFICSLSRDGKVIAEGRGATVLGPNNKWLSRAIESAANSALSESMIKATKVLGTFLSPSGSAVSLEEAYSAMQTQKNSEPASEKQKNYLVQLIQVNVEDEDEREQQISQIEDISKSEASALIQSFVG